MSANRLSSLLAGAALIGVAAAAFAASDGASLGTTLAGETCRLSGGDIVCGDAVAGTQRISQLAAGLPADEAGRHAAILAGAKALPGGLATTQDVACDPAQWIGGDAALYLCTLRSNNWPRVILVGASGNTLVAAEGLPSMLPVLEAALQSATGRGAAPGESDAAVALMRAKYGEAGLKLASGDFSGYRKYVEAARMYGGADNYAGAEDAYRHALDVETRLFGDDALAVGETLAELALQVSNQGRFDEAAALFRRAQPIIEGSASASARARLASYQALDAANQRDYADALKYARAATALRRAEVDAAKAASVSAGAETVEPVAPVALEGELAHSLRIESEMALRLGDNASAQAAAEEALWIITEEPGLPLWWRPEMVALMGEVNAAQGRVVVAERDFTEALTLDQKLFGDTAPTARAHLRLGQFYAQQQLYTASVASYHSAFAILGKDRVARSQIVSDQIVPFLAAATALAVQDPSQKPALDAEMFGAAQLVNSGVADQTIARVAAREAAGDPALSGLVRQLEAAQARRETARLELVAENAKPNDERNAQLLARYDLDLKSAGSDADALRAKVTQSYPAYARLADPGPVTLGDFQKQLGAGEAFLTFVVGAKGSFALVVRAGGFTAAPLAATSDSLASDVTELRAALVPRLGRLSDFSLNASYALYKQLIAPVEPALASATHLIVAPGGALDSLPLALLVTAEPKGGYANAAWLIRRLAISQVPSPRALVTLRAEPAGRAPRPFFGVGNPAFTGNGSKALSALAAACVQGAAADPALLRALPPLPETAGEVQSVGRTLGAQPGSILLGSAATEGAVRSAGLDQYAVLYFATHGMLPGELHCQAEPGLVLSPPPGAAASAASDGLLSASEISALHLNADLVVLSACNTAAGGGGKFGGGALEGLADSFFNAGAHAVLASHWEVPSAATQTLMTTVFARYAKDPRRDLAEDLRQAQLAMIAQGPTAHPFNWAAFTLIGDSGSTAQVAMGDRK
ncbi:MAG: CHAT domain-containing tetratricopeptide repeat protein [Rhizomicrobium sp.]